MGRRRLTTEEDIRSKAVDTDEIAPDATTKDKIAPDEVTGEELWIDQATEQAVIPIGGGTTNVVITIEGLEKIAEVTDIEIIESDPSAHDIYEPTGLEITGNSFGVTVSGDATGTTLTVKGTAIGTTS